MQLRLLEYLIALADEKHFAGAARRCHVTQPTLSGGLANLERQLGKRLVLRDKRFIDFTPEGHAVLPYARQLIAQHDEMRRAIDASGPLRGIMRLGAIPAAMPNLGLLLGQLRADHPALRVEVRQLTSSEIARGLRDYELDAAMTYLNAEPLAGLRHAALYEERYRFAAPAGSPLAAKGAVSLEEAVSQPLGLLNQGMQNRRILDRHLLARGLTVEPAVTADSYLALISLVSRAGICSIVTDSHAHFISEDSGIRLLEIADLPEPNQVGVVVLDHDPVSQLAHAALAAARKAGSGGG